MVRCEVSLRRLRRRLVEQPKLSCLFISTMLQDSSLGDAMLTVDICVVDVMCKSVKQVTKKKKEGTNGKSRCPAHHDDELHFTRDMNLASELTLPTHGDAQRPTPRGVDIDTTCPGEAVACLHNH